MSSSEDSDRMREWAEKIRVAIRGLRRWSTDTEWNPDQIVPLLSTFADGVVKDRDMDWWRELVLCDAVAPTPEAAKAWLMALCQDEREVDAARAEAAEAGKREAEGALAAVGLERHPSTLGPEYHWILPKPEILQRLDALERGNREAEERARGLLECNRELCSRLMPDEERCKLEGDIRTLEAEVARLREKCGDMTAIADAASELVYGGECGWEAEGFGLKRLKDDLYLRFARLREEREELKANARGAIDAGEVIIDTFRKERDAAQRQVEELRGELAEVRAEYRCFGCDARMTPVAAEKHFHSLITVPGEDYIALKARLSDLERERDRLRGELLEERDLAAVAQDKLDRQALLLRESRERRRGHRRANKSLRQARDAAWAERDEAREKLVAEQRVADAAWAWLTEIEAVTQGAKRAVAKGKMPTRAALQGTEPRPTQPECPGERCPMCSGEACDLCGAGMRNDAPHCAHDSVERHQKPQGTEPKTEGGKS